MCKRQIYANMVLDDVGDGSKFHSFEKYNQERREKPYRFSK